MTKQKSASNGMKVERVDISTVKPPDKNVRIHTRLQIQELKRSLEMFGQTRPAVVDEDNIVLIGNGMIEAMREAGMNQVDIYRKEGLSKDDKIKLMLADNRIYGLGHDDSVIIQELLSGIADMDIPGFDSEVLEALAVNVESMEATLQEYGKIDDDEAGEMRSSEQIGDTRNIICPHCGESIWIQ